MEEEYVQFNGKVFSESIFNETLKIHDTDLVKNFWKKDTFYLETQEDVDKLLTVITDVESEYDAVNRYFTVKVNTWPYPKTTSLLAIKKDPSKWVYRDDSGKDLFKYNQTELTITLM